VRAVSRVFVHVLSIAGILSLPGSVFAQDIRTLVVVPFTDITPSEDDTWVGIGISETLITNLRNEANLNTIDRTTVLETIATTAQSSRQPNDRSLPLEIARVLNADLTLSGSYQRNGSQLRLTATLLDVRQRQTVETFTIDGPYSDLFVLQDQLAHGVANAIEVHQLTTSSNTTRPTPEPSTDRVVTRRQQNTETTSFSAPPGQTNPQSGRAGAAQSEAVRDGVFAIRNRPSVLVVRTDEPPEIDGRLDEAMWDDAVLITDFVQTSPIEGAPPTENTEVRIAYDANNIYFAFYARYLDPSQMRANRVDRDQARRDDWIAVMFDTFLDQQRAYRFSVNAYGVQNDAILTGGRRMRGPPGGGGDSSWDALFESRGVLVDDGWTAELAIPFKSLRYPSPDNGEHQWGFQITRTVQTKDETVVWSPTTRNVSGILTQMGTLNGLRNLSSSRNLEILPTATAIQLGKLTDTGFQEGDVQPDIGLNVKYGVTSDLTADFTVNPDFSQIESDRPQIEVNQRFPLYYPELRPFFLEGQEIFRTPGRVSLVHTRTIVDPQFGAKLTGKTGNTTLGVLVTNDEATGRLDDSNHPAFGQNGKFFVGRARYDLHSESYIGAIVTDRDFFGSFSRVGGVDGRIRIGQTHSAQFVAVASSNRDLDGNEKTGPLFDFAFRRDSRHINYRLQYNVIDPNFDTATGFVRRVDTRRLDADIEYVWWPESWIINWGPRFSYLRNDDHTGVLQDEDFRANINMRFYRNIFFRIDGRRELERYRNINFFKTRFSLRNSINTDRRVSLFYGLDWGDQIRFIDNPFLGRFFEYNIGATLRPTSRLNTQINIDTSRFQNTSTNQMEFDVKIFRAFTTYQFTDRFLVRNILEHNTGTGEVGVNVLFTYRVNAGTVFYIGYDDRLKEWVNMNEERYLASFLERQRRAFFTKFQYLFRY